MELTQFNSKLLDKEIKNSYFYIFQQQMLGNFISVSNKITSF